MNWTYRIEFSKRWLVARVDVVTDDMAMRQLKPSILSDRSGDSVSTQYTVLGGRVEADRGNHHCTRVMRRSYIHVTVIERDDEAF
jgi:hypothetical protein